MSRLSTMRVTVAGAGALGSVIALALAREGAKVTLADPAAEGTNASAIAAGMLAPAFEAALDPSSTGHFALYREARDRWPGFVADLDGVEVHRDGALFVGPPDAGAMLAKLWAVGAEVQATEHGVYTPDDWRLDPPTTLAAMRRRLIALGAGIEAGAAESLPRGDALILACGYGGLGLAPELARLEPIKGQLLQFRGGPTEGPILRGDLGYLVPSPRGAIVGATMQPGVTDPAPEPAEDAGLLAIAESLRPGLAEAPYEARAGVRAATPDGLPLVGSSVRPGVWLAAGARRNGWLLAPLIAEIIVDQLSGGQGGPFAALFNPVRFGASA